MSQGVDSSGDPKPRPQYLGGPWDGAEYVGPVSELESRSGQLYPIPVFRSNVSYWAYYRYDGTNLIYSHSDQPKKTE